MSRRRSRAPLVVSLIVGAILLVGVAVGAALVVPPIVRAAQTEVAAGSTEVDVATTGAAAQLTVEDGWSYLVDPFDAASATIQSPDGEMTVTFTVLRTGDAEAAVRARAGGALAPFDDEPVGATRVLHTRAVDDDATVGAVVAGEAAVLFDARPTTGYDAELALLLSHVVITSPGATP